MDATIEASIRTYQLNELAKLINAEIKGDASKKIFNIAPISAAKEGELTYLIGGQYRKFLTNTTASAVILSGEDLADCPATTTALIVKNPELAFARIAALFDTREKMIPGIHPQAFVGANCHIDSTVSIGAKAVIGNGVTIHASSVIMPGVVIGDHVEIGKNCVINSNVTIYHGCVLGNEVILHSGAVIGADGFGYANENGQWIKIPQIGRVIIEDNVEIGANTAIDRGALSDTIIRRGVKIDNCVQVGHNVEIGEHTIIAGCAAIAGSVKIGRHCMIGGASCINGHITITDNVVITGSANILLAITEPGIYSSGIDARPHLQWGKTVIRIHQLDDLAKRVKKLERQTNE